MADRDDGRDRVVPTRDAEAPGSIEELFGEANSPLPPAIAQWLRWRSALLLLPLLGVLLPVSLWWRYQARHVSTMNAAVRGNLAEIGARLEGIVATVAVDVGDRVTAGQPLLRLEDRHLLAAMREARAEVESLKHAIEVERSSIGMAERALERQELDATTLLSAADSLVSGECDGEAPAEAELALASPGQGSTTAPSFPEVYSADFTDAVAAPLEFRGDSSDGSPRITEVQPVAPTPGRVQSRHHLAEVEETRAELSGLERAIELESAANQARRDGFERLELETNARIAAARARCLQAKVVEEAARVKQTAFESAEVASSTWTSVFERLSIQVDHRVAEARVAELEQDLAVAEQSGERALAQAIDDTNLSDRRIGVLEANLEAARARRTRAEARLAEAARTAERTLQDGRDTLLVREISLSILESDLQAAEARLARAEAEAEAATIRAPEAGAIVRRMIHPGGSADVGQPMFSLWLGEDVWVEAWIEETDLGFLRVGTEATVTLRAFPGRTFAGIVQCVGLATDMEFPEAEVPRPRSSRMSGAPVIAVRIQLEERVELLVPGLSASVAFEK